MREIAALRTRKRIRVGAALLIACGLFSAASDAQGVRKPSPNLISTHPRFELDRWTIEDGLPELSINAILQTRDGYLWLATYGGLARFDGRQFKVFDRARTDGIASNRFITLFEDRRGALWAGTEEGWLTRYVADRFTTYTNRNGLPGQSGMRLGDDEAGRLWVDVGAALLRFDNERFVAAANDSAPFAEPGTPPHPFLLDHRGITWQPVFGGINLHLPNGATMMLAPDGLIGEGVLTIYEDREDEVWIGTLQGLYRAREIAFDVYGEREGLASNLAYCIFQDHTGDVWVGTWGGGLDCYHNGRFTHRRVEEGLASNRITAIAEDRDGTLWVGASGGLHRIRNGRVVRTRMLDHLFNSSIWAIQQDRAGSLWFGTDRGLVQSSEGRLTVFTVKDGLPDNEVTAICETRAGELWVGTRGGVARRQGDRFVAFSEKDGLSSGHVRALYEDGEGTIWAGTYDGGLNRLKDGRITRFTTNDGLFDNGVFAILEDSAGNFWMSCNRGICRLSKRQLDDYAEGRSHYLTAIAYGAKDGLRSPECNGGRQPAGWKMRDGTLWFPTMAGVAVIDPRKVSMIKQPPPVVIEAFRLDNEPVALQTDLRVAPGQQQIEIQFNALSIAKPDLVRIKYRLVGVNNEWVEAGERRRAHYSRLAPGSYVFEVIAANRDGVWNTDGCRLRFMVLPPFWQSGWFIGAACLVLILLTGLLLRWRILRMQRAHAAQQVFARRLIESQERERERIAAELHDGLGQSLAMIRHRALLAVTQAEDRAGARRQLDEIAVQAGASLDELREIAHNLRPYQLDQLGLTRALRAMLRNVAESSALRVSATIDDVDGLLPKAAEINLYRIVQEGVNNALKHARASALAVRVDRRKSGIEICVQDDGRGFDADAMAQGRNGHAGLGLMSIRERARVIGGRARIHSTPGEGTKVVVTIKIKEPAE